MIFCRSSTYRTVTWCKVPQHEGGRVQRYVVDTGPGARRARHILLNIFRYQSNIFELFAITKYFYLHGSVLDVVVGEEGAGGRVPAEADGVALHSADHEVGRRVGQHRRVRRVRRGLQTVRHSQNLNIFGR